MITLKAPTAIVNHSVEQDRMWHRATPAEGMDEAIRRIAKTKKNGRNWLDLGDLPIVHIPKEIECLGNQLHLLALGKIGLSGKSTNPKWGFDNRRPSSIQNLTSIRSLPNLKILNLDYCEQLVDISPLQFLEQVTELSLVSCWRVLDLRPIRSLHQLSKLDARFCTSLVKFPVFDRLGTITDLGFSQVQNITLEEIQPLVNLKCLYLSSCDQLTDLELLRTFTKLVYLDLSYCDQVVNEKVIGSLTQLRGLSLDGCEQLASISSLASLSHLTSFDISSCAQLCDLRPLESFQELRQLRLNHCATEADLKPCNPSVSGSGVARLRQIS